MEQLIREILNELRNATGAPAPDANSARAKESTSASEADAGKGDADTADARRTTAPDPLPDAPLDPNRLAQIIRRHNEGRAASEQPFAKKRLLPYYLHVKEADPARWGSWNVDEALERRLVQTLRMKPRRTASGVATITVLTKPWPCSGDCLYCPNDLRMPKSYLADEPACQRAERNWFDPYLQVTARLHALVEMGHVTDKVELIVLGGTWSDYPQDYQAWFVHELFRALNDGDGDEARRAAEERRALYRSHGIANRAEDAAAHVAAAQQEVRDGTLTYNLAVRQLYQKDASWQAVAARQRAMLEEVAAQQAANEQARHRCVGLVVETRPDAVTPESLTLLRRFGCTKVQMGIQSLDPAVLALNCRTANVESVRHAFELLRLFGFKTHVHAMANLCGSTPERDKQDYRRLVTDAPYQPDEVKLYPCVLVEGTGLGARAKRGDWRPYDEETLVDVLAADVLATPPYTRISRMIRDISAHDIVAGNRKTNLRQLVEAHVEAAGAPIEEMRHREIGADAAEAAGLTLSVVRYRTTVSEECFLQWVTPENRIAGFLRLSLPDPACVEALGGAAPVCPHEAMIREVHVYGKVASLHGDGQNAQHRGLGKRLVETACDLAREQGYRAVNVISAVGTRAYYRTLGFVDGGLYQQKSLLP